MADVLGFCFGGILVDAVLWFQIWKKAQTCKHCVWKFLRIFFLLPILLYISPIIALLRSDMEKGADMQTLSVEMFEYCGNIWIVKIFYSYFGIKSYEI